MDALEIPVRQTRLVSIVLLAIHLRIKVVFQVAVYLGKRPVASAIIEVKSARGAV